MTKLAGLVEKELRQSGPTLAIISAMIGLAVLGAVMNDSFLQLLGSKLDAARYVILIFVPLGAYVLTGSMICGEFRHRTQIFLEGLPLPRWQLFSIKFALGGGTTLGTSWAIVAVAAWLSRHGESFTTGFAALLLVKSGVWACFAWSLAFALAFLGRYRLPIIILLVLGLILLHVGGFAVNRFGPLHLLDSRFAFERDQWPVAALVATAGLSLLLSVVGFALGSVRYTTVAAMLAERMSLLERLVIGLLGVSMVLAFAQLKKARQNSQPVHLPGSVDWLGAGVTVQVAAAVETPTEAERQALQRWADQTGLFLQETAVWLRRAQLPPLFVVHRRDFDRARLEWGAINSRQGVLVRLNLMENDPEDPALRERLLHRLLDAALHRRLTIQGDEAGWVLDGFAHEWPRRAGTTVVPPALKHTPSASEFSQWMKIRKNLGENESARLAAVALDLLAERGADKQRDFISAILGRTVPHHSGALLQEWMHPPARLLREHTGLEWSTLAEAWQQRLHRRVEPTSPPSLPESPSP